MSDEKNKIIDALAATAINGLIAGKQIIATRNPGSNLGLSEIQLDKSKSITPKEVAHWAYEIAEEMYKNSKAK